MAKKNGSNSRKRRERLVHPTDSHLREAREIAAQYIAVLEPQKGGGYRGRTLELPYVMGFGKTAQQCVADLQDSLVAGISTLLALREPVPPPAADNRRDDQVNIKLTKREKAFMTAAAKREGFRSVADFMRSLAMRRLA